MRYLPTYLVASGKSLWVGGGGLALLELSGVISAFVAGNWSDRVGRRRILAGSMLGASVFMLLFVHADGWLLAPALVGLGIFSMASMPVTLAIIQDLLPGVTRRGQWAFHGFERPYGLLHALFRGLAGRCHGFQGRVYRLRPGKLRGRASGGAFAAPGKGAARRILMRARPSPRCCLAGLAWIFSMIRGAI